MKGVFKTKQELRDFIARNIPIMVKPVAKTKKSFVGVFKSNNAMRAVIDNLTDKIWEKINIH